MRKENYSDLTSEEPPKCKVTKLPHKKETHKHQPHEHNLLTPYGYKETIVTAKKYLSHRKWDVNGHARPRLQGKHNVKDAVVIRPLQERTELSPGKTKEHGYHDNASKR